MLMMDVVNVILVVVAFYAVMIMPTQVFNLLKARLPKAYSKLWMATFATALWFLAPKILGEEFGTTVVWAGGIAWCIGWLASNVTATAMTEQKKTGSLEQDDKFDIMQMNSTENPFFYNSDD